MNNQSRCSKSFSCESLFNERHSLKRKYAKVFDTSTSSNTNGSNILTAMFNNNNNNNNNSHNISGHNNNSHFGSNGTTTVGAVANVANLSFKNDDYNYLINNNELIMTCREALLENEGSVKCSNNTADFNLLSSPGSSTSGANSLFDGKTIASPNPKNVENMSMKEFSKWLNRTEKHLESVCYCSFRQGNVSFNSLGNTSSGSSISLTSHQREWIDAITEHKAIQAEIQSVGRRFINSLKANANGVNKSLLTAEENRWHNLWLKSFECLMILEEHHICPNHSHWNRERLSAPFDNSKRYKLGPKAALSEGKENIGMMRNRRIQTNMIGTGGGPGLNETFNITNGKYEIIHKDIGYSSDADMSDACEPTSCSNFIASSVKSPRKRHRRRRPRIGERPWSFHSEWTGWDYYQPPLGFSGEYRSSEDLNSYEDENLVRSLTEFGENYERWFKPDDGILRASTPSPSQTPSPSERSERPETDNENNSTRYPSPTPCFCPSSINININNNNQINTTQEVNDKLNHEPILVANGSVNCSTATSNIAATTASNTTFTKTLSSPLPCPSTKTKTTTTSSSSSSSTTKSFFIYLTVTIIIALILSALVAQLSPLSPHVQKSYPNRTPPN